MFDSDTGVELARRSPRWNGAVGGAAAAARYARGINRVCVEQVRSLHTSTFQLNLSRFWHQTHREAALTPHNTPYTSPLTSPQCKPHPMESAHGESKIGRV